MLSSFKRILNKNQRWIDKKVKRMRPSEATMFEATVRVAINFVLDIDEIPKEAKETMDDLDRIFEQINPTSLFSSYIDQARLAITEPSKFIRGLYSFYDNKATEIKNDRSQEQLFYLLYTCRTKLSETGNTICGILTAMISYQLDFLNPNPNRTDLAVCGLTTYGELMTVNIPYPGFKSAVMEIEMNHCSDTAVINICKSHGMPVNSNEEYDILFNMLDLYSKHVHFLSPFLDEYTYDILPNFKTLKPRETDTPLFNIIFHRNFCDNILEIATQIQNKRRKTLPLNGVMIYFRSCDKNFPVQRILMKEVFHSDKPTVLYKAETLIGDLSGYYDISSSVICNILAITRWANYDAQNTIPYMITYLYACIVLDKENGLFENIYRYMGFVKESDDNGKPLTLFPYEIKIQSLGNKKEDVYHPECKNASSKGISVKSYPTRIIKVPAYVRSVPKGDSTSQIAKDLAQKVGIELKEGETYVRPHEKTVHTLKQDFPWREHTLTAKEA